MGNATNDENWAARARLREIELRLWWRGYVGRKELMAHFGMSPAQVSSDIQKYLKLAGDTVIYHTSRKRYETLPKMKPVMHRPLLEEGLQVALDQEVRGTQRPTAGMQERSSDLVSVVRMPHREVDPTILRFLVLAASQSYRKGTPFKVKVNYTSVSSGRSSAREIVPRAFGFNGRRWHVRAYCLKTKGWRDFVLGRFEAVGWPEEGPVVPIDGEWDRIEAITLRINPELEEEQRRAIRLDYGLEGDELTFEVRSAMREYVLSNLMLRRKGMEKRPSHFVLE